VGHDPDRPAELLPGSSQDVRTVAVRRVEVRALISEISTKPLAPSQSTRKAASWLRPRRRSTADGRDGAELHLEIDHLVAELLDPGDSLSKLETGS